MSRLARDGTAESVSRVQILRHEFERGQGIIHFSCLADHVQDWQPYPVDPYSYYMCDHTYKLYMEDAPRQPHAVTNNFMCPLLFIFLFDSEDQMSLFPSIFVPSPFPHCMESTSCGFDKEVSFRYKVVRLHVSFYGHTTYSKSMDQPGKAVSPARGQLNRKK